jgi:hypothetical protein
MKPKFKAFIAVFLLLAISTVGFSQTKKPHNTASLPQQKDSVVKDSAINVSAVTVTFKLDEFEFIYNLINKSNAPHNAVEQILSVMAEAYYYQTHPNAKRGEPIKEQPKK